MSAPQLVTVPVTQDDVDALEAAAEALARAREVRHAINLWALVLRVRTALNLEAIT